MSCLDQIFESLQKVKKLQSSMYKPVAAYIGFILFMKVLFVTFLFLIFMLVVVFPTITNHCSFFHPVRLFLNFYAVFISFLIIYNIITVRFTDPGSIPQKFIDSVESIPEYCEEFSTTKKGKGFSRFCNACKKPKPPRTHHCSTCQRCVVRMDHHCVWINNCVGFRNYQYFLQLLILGAIGCISAILFLSSLYFRVFQFADYSMMNGRWNLHFKAALIIAFAYLVADLIFLLVHTYLSFTNQTTIELLRNKDIAFKRGSWNPGSANLYNLGSVKENLYHAFWERNWFKILFCPFIERNPPCDGFSYNRKRKDD